MINLEQNWTEFVRMLKTVDRDGIDKLIEYLEKTDFKTAPASTAFHLNEKGGLVQHSLNVNNFIHEEHQSLITRVTDNISYDSLTIAGLLHDICKVNFYVQEMKWYKDQDNKWQQKQVWGVDDQLPLGHGEKSVIIVNRFIPLTSAEMAAIRWHMIGFDPGIHFNYPSGLPYRAAMEKYPLCKYLAIADQKAELYESLQAMESKHGDHVSD